MCRLIKGKMVKNECDLQNLITGIIYRQKANFNERKIIALVAEGLKESDYVNLNSAFGKQYIKEMVDSTLIEFSCSKIVKSQQGSYILV